LLGAANRLGRLVTNQFADGDETFKLWPASLDQDAYRAVMTDHETAPTKSLIVEAHQFFYTQVYEWLGEVETTERRKDLAAGLVTALLGLLEMVVIDLDSTDDPYVIFETLNARGTPLIASDLVKNFVLQTVHDLGLSADEFYSKNWKQLEDKWWRQEIRQGRLRRPRVDVFLNYWLVSDLAEEVQSHLVFTSFREKVRGTEPKIGDIVADVMRVAKIYRGWDEIDQSSEFGTFLYRWRVLDAGVTTPLLLAVFDGLHERPDELLRTLRLIESYLIRRMVTRMTTKDYNGIVLELVSRIKASADPVDLTTADYLLESDSESRLWPTDGAVRKGLSHLPLYRMLTRGRLRMVLEALEDQLRGPKTEDEFVRRGKLTIEHVMPQQWQSHWPPLVGDDLEDAQVERERLVHSIGNLTLVTKSLNPALSNGPWVDKQKALNRHGVLLLNSELVREYGDDWFLEDQIKERSRVLADRICETWPGPAVGG
jgi:hypothetical protein